jgi:anhydro-N-acetylmuramic acid kinase
VARKVKGREREAIWAVGTMSGTSLDGVDAALLKTDGRDIEAFGGTAYRGYTAPERSVLRAVLGCWPEDDVTEAAALVLAAHHAVLGRLKEASVVGFHGQTVAHDPRGKGTHQLGDGAALARALGVPVVWDFRTADVSLGGEGAPLAPFFHHACARFVGASEPVAFLNLGGVGNLSLVDPRIADPAQDGALLAFDTGPANAPIDDLMLARRGQARDEHGALAESGVVAEAVLETFLHDPYFARTPPKSLDRDAFAFARALVDELGDADAAATLTAMAAVSVMQGLKLCPAPPARVLVTGGGRHNRTIMRMLAAGVECPVDPVEAVGLNGDMLEAQAFAYLAVRVLYGLPTSAPGTTGVAAPVVGGQIATP